MNHENRDYLVYLYIFTVLHLRFVSLSDSKWDMMYPNDPVDQFATGHSKEICKALEEGKGVRVVWVGIFLSRMKTALFILISPGNN